ncbi:hypothetical protein IFM89_037000 [Coptis chinensis]|uniref:Uncharacterized protein n=1 Tax=Coptis chinensis TaxID=261450 RepID=A0A835HF50_9MAGN|nr:hypothetical protein IFM89_037000 [Coptis chinensis]
MAVISKKTKVMQFSLGVGAGAAVALVSYVLLDKLYSLRRKYTGRKSGVGNNIEAVQPGVEITLGPMYGRVIDRNDVSNLLTDLQPGSVIIEMSSYPFRRSTDSAAIRELSIQFKGIAEINLTSASRVHHFRHRFMCIEPSPIPPIPVTIDVDLPVVDISDTPPILRKEKRHAECRLDMLIVAYSITNYTLGSSFVS